MCIVSVVYVIIEKGDFPENVHRVVYVITEEGDFPELEICIVLSVS